MDFTVKTIEMNMVQITDNTTEQDYFFSIDDYGSVAACVRAFLCAVDA